MNKKSIGIMVGVVVFIASMGILKNSINNNNNIQLKLETAEKSNEGNKTLIEKESKVDSEISSLISRSIGDETSDIVIVYAQGGPITEVEEEVLEEFRDSHEKLQNALILQAHQIQTESPELFMTEEITFDQAIEYDKKTLENITKIVKHYKLKGKKVYVIGVSFGAFVVTDLIAEEGPNLADGYGIMVGRLDMDDVFWKGFSQGKGGEFKGGVEPVLNQSECVEEANMYKLAAGIGHKRFTEELKDMDLSRLVYAYGKVDEAVGALTADEIKFLQDRKATILANEGGHSEASTYEVPGMMNFLLNEK